MKSVIELKGRKIGPGYPAFIIAEMSANHQNTFDQALEIVREAKRAGADAIKLQTYTADTLTIRSDKPYFHIKSGTQWDGTTLYELYREAHTPWEWHPKIMELADSLGLICFSSPFDPTAVTFLESLHVPAYKIASFEIVDIPLIRIVASTGKPIILSTGMSTAEEIGEALQAVQNTGNQQAALLKCTSAYPAPPHEMNLRAIQKLAEQFQVPVGLSDHTLGIVAPITAVSLGACIIEKHFTLSRSNPGPDSRFSLEPSEFKAMVDAIRVAEAALGDRDYTPGREELKSRVFRRSLFVVRSVKRGEPFTEENIRSIRPGDGLAPKYYPALIGRRAACDIEAGTPLSWDLVLDGHNTLVGR